MEDDDEYLNGLIVRANRTLDDVANDVRRHLSGAVENIIKAGHALQEGRDLHISNIAFHKWCDEEFPDLKPKMRERMMQVGRRFDTTFMSQQMPITVLYELAAPSVPDELVEDFMSSEEPIKVKDVKQAKEGYKKVQDKGNEDLLEAVSSGLMKPREAAKKALSRAEELTLEFNSLTEEEKIERLGGAKKIDAAYQRKLDETLGDDFNPNNAATGILISLNRLRLFGGKKEIEHYVLGELHRSIRMQKYEAEALLMLADVVNENYDEIASFMEHKPNLKVVN
jgi:hypothetical protein